MYTPGKKFVDLSPTRTAAKQLARLLPNEHDRGTSGAESWRFFHLVTDDLITVERTIELACKIEKLPQPYFLSIDQFHKLLTSPAAGKAVDCDYRFEKLYDEATIKEGCQYFVWQAVTRADYERIDQLRHGQLMLEFLQFCEEIRAGMLGQQALGVRGSDNLLTKRVTFIFYGPPCQMPELVRNSMRTISYKPLTDRDFALLLQEHTLRATERQHARLLNALGQGANQLTPTQEPPEFSAETLQWYANRMAGISELNVHRLLSEMWEDFNSGDVDFTCFEKVEARIVDYKNAILKQHGRLEVIKTEHSPRQKRATDGSNPQVDTGGIEGLDTIRNWLINHRDVVRNEKLAPTGILLVGIPGTGKSATAKMAASVLNLPLVKLDMSKILGGRVGESEKNMQEMLTDLAFAAPCVLWIDEVEKALSGADGKENSGGSGVVQRLFGMLLTFMQENKRPVFTVTTANDISKLPPEFFRNGRFDQAFCVMMPEYRGCVAIMKRKLTERMMDKGWFPAPLDSAAMEDYAKQAFDACVGTKESPRFLTGADIEAHVKELFVSYRHQGCPLPTASELAEEMGKVAATMRAQVSADSLDALRDTAARYLDMIQRGLTMAGNVDTPFVKKNLHLEHVRFFSFDPEDAHAAPPRDCLVHPKLRELEAQLRDATEPEQWYDAKFFKLMVQYMNEAIIFDRNLTQEDTRHAYWAWKTTDDH